MLKNLTKQKFMSLVVLSTLTLGLTGCSQYSAPEPFQTNVQKSNMELHKKQKLLNEVIKYQFNKLYPEWKMNSHYKSDYVVVQGCIEFEHKTRLGLHLFNNCYELDGDNIKHIDKSVALAKGSKDFRKARYLFPQAKEYRDFINRFSEFGIYLQIHYNEMLKDKNYLKNKL